MFSIAGVVLSVLLCTKIVSQWRYLKAHREELKTLRDNAKERRNKLRESITVLCHSMQAEQIEISEGCMRVKILLDHLDARLHHDEDYAVFDLVYQRLQKMPRFEQRKSVDRRVLQKLDETRYAVENEHKKAVLVACGKLITKLRTLN